MFMSDDKKNHGSPDNKLIDVNDPKEIWNWTTSLGISEERLREAVKAAGTSAEKVRDYLDKR